MVVVVEFVLLCYFSLPDDPDWGSRACAYVCLEEKRVVDIEVNSKLYMYGGGY
jgi:hypothetical protein